MCHMGMGIQTHATNDNLHLTKHGFEDRTGFNSFLKAMTAEKTYLDESLQTQSIEESHKPSLLIKIFQTLAYIGLSLVAVAAVFSLVATTSPLLHVISLVSLVTLSVSLSFYSAYKSFDRLQALSLIVAILLSFGLMVMIGDYFALTLLNISNDGLWLITTAMSLTIGGLLKSRTALMLSITMATLWGYGYLSGSLNITQAVIGFPVAALGQIFLSSYLADRIGKFASILMFWIWGGTVLSLAYAQGLLIIPMMISGLMMGFGAYYVSKAHMLNAWSETQQKPTRPWSWLALMSTAFLAALFWWSPSLFPTIGNASPLTQFIWQIGLVAGSCFMLIASLLRRSRDTYSLSRRILSSLVIIAVSTALYFQPRIIAFLGSPLANEIRLAIYLATIGVLAVLAFRKFTQAIRNSYLSWLMASSLILIGIFFACVQIEFWTYEITTVSVIAGMICLCALAWTQKETNKPSSVYRPLSKRDKKRRGPIYSYSDMSMMQARAS